jgi:excisionase family DNA binding protein
VTGGGAPEILTSTQAAELLGVHPTTVGRWIRNGRLAAENTPGGHHRIRRADAEALRDQILQDQQEDQRRRAEQATKIVRLYESGLSAQQVADKIGQPIKGVYGALKSEGVTIRRGAAAWPRPLQPCGTKAGYVRHIKRGEEACGPCKRANADYTNDINRRTGRYKARDRAYQRLVVKHRKVFKVLLAREVKRARVERAGEAAKAWRSRARRRACYGLGDLFLVEFEEFLAEEIRKVSKES